MTQELQNKHEGEEATLPLERIFTIAEVPKVLDLILANRGLKYTAEDIANIGNLEQGRVQKALKILKAERIIKSQKGETETVYFPNPSSDRTDGLFRYVRATLDENLTMNEHRK